MSTSPIQFSDDKKKLMYIAYGLFAISIVLGGLTAIAGVILIYLKRSEMQGTIYADHCSFLIRTFWGAVIAFVIGFILSTILIGGFVLFLIPIWYLLRIIYGLLKLHDGKSVTPTGWLI